MPFPAVFTMETKSFWGRERELAKLMGLAEIENAQLAVVKGRRRIGKSRLIQEFAKRCKSFGYESFYFTGMAPDDKITKEMEREDFAFQMSREFSIPIPASKDWNNLFWTLADNTAEKKSIVILDEINWLGGKDPTFLAKLKSSWDRDFSNRKHCILILSGSLAGWIEKNILKSTGFLGRISIDLTLGELPPHICAKFWKKKLSRISSYEVIKTLLVTGGVPKYLEEINSSKTFDENIFNMCFDPSGLLYREFKQIFNDIYSKKSPLYRRVLERLSNGKMELTKLERELELGYHSGSLNAIIDELEKTGFVKRDFTWNIKTEKESSLSSLRLKDNYTRFYLKVIEKHISKIKNQTLRELPRIEPYMGLQFENLVLNNRSFVWKKLNIKPDHIVMDNPFFQRKTERNQGCQVDYLIQTKQKTIYLCEIKFSNKEVPPSIVQEVREKVNRISLPKQLSIRPVLIHVNGVQDAVKDADFFDNIIDFSDALHESL